MVKPDRKKVEKLKKQDEVLEGLPSLEKEKKRFRKDESKLEHWVKKKSVTPKRVKTIRKKVEKKGRSGSKKR